MIVTLSNDQADYVSNKVASGEYPTADDVVRDALRLLRAADEDQHRLAELRREVDIGIKEADEGKCAPLNVREILARVQARRSVSEPKGA